MEDKLLVEEITKKVLEKIENILEENKRNKNKENEIVIGVGPTFNSEVKITLNGLKHNEVIREIIAGIEEEGFTARIIKVYKTADVAFIGKEAANISGSGIGIGLQSKGTALIHHRDLYPLSNLELFPQAPLIDLKTYRNIGKNAAKYGKKENPIPITVKNDSMIRPKYQVKAALFHIKDTEKVIKDGKSIEIIVED
ncbi:propanediol utilization: dehydratase, medium subunit [Clostridium fallax]|uniref:Glycerol dehydratase medium subunit/propanediol dehydratase medium subunit n=1 Tax=Clostridium fallax TaxID=1533 RepID=A0A1M4XCW4_9CLOT|nr:glycerol dehydratase medium subunit/propanediol dehydratase medium subunit [Clostridium fallax]SQB05984.1 propanediol utilization: dehydratase, medium subunit [Clostridium fallax]